MWFSRRRAVIGLAPEGAALASSRGDKAVRREYAATPEVGDGEELALGCLAGLLDEGPWDGVRVTVALSHQLVRVLTVPWSDELMRPASAEAYLRAQCAAVFGHGAHAWTLAVDDVPRGQPALACAVNRDFLAGIHRIVEGRGARVESVVPWMIAAFNRSCRKLPDDCWFAAIEPARIALLDVREGSVFHVSLHGWTGDAGTALDRFVRRGALRNGTDAARPVRIVDLAGGVTGREESSSRRIEWSWSDETSWLAGLAAVSR